MSGPFKSSLLARASRSGGGERSTTVRGGGAGGAGVVINPSISGIAGFNGAVGTMVRVFTRLSGIGTTRIGTAPHRSVNIVGLSGGAVGAPRCVATISNAATKPDAPHA